MMGLKFMGDVPFRDVYIHALVRDAEGQKMSKSKGNVIDPLHVMEQFGTDALRFTLASMASPGRDIKLAEERIEGYRNFANKIWNAARFSLINLDGPRTAIAPAERTFPDRWILSRLNHTIQMVTSELEAYRFDRAANALYQFIWHEYCDWYLELIKPTLQNLASPDAPGTRQTLVETLETTMRLLHPFMPFLTEEIWHQLPHQGESIVIQSYPTTESAWTAPEMEERFIAARSNHRLSAHIPRALELYAGAEDHVLPRARRTSATGPPRPPPKLPRASRSRHGRASPRDGVADQQPSPIGAGRLIRRHCDHRRC